MMRTLDKVFEMFKVFSKWFVGFFLALYVFPKKGGLMDMVKLFKKIFVKSSQVIIEFSAKLYSIFWLGP